MTPVKSHEVVCDKAILTHTDSDLVVQYLVQDVPEYNSYKGYAGEDVLNDELTGLQTVAGHLASWLIVVDVSDPAGRRETILHSAAMATRLVTLMSGRSNARILALAGSLNMAADFEMLAGIMTGGELCNKPIYQVTRNGITYGDPAFAAVVESIRRADRIQKNNTNIWLGVNRALKDEMKKCASGIYKNLPKGIILISDGVDESSTSNNDFNDLVQEAKNQGVPIHTIAMRHKDSARGASGSTAVHQGFDAMQKLAMSTGGGYLTYEELPGSDHPACIARLNNMLARTAAGILEMRTPMLGVPAASSVRVNLNNGRNFVGSVEIDQKNLAPVVAEHALLEMQQLKALFNDPKSTESEKSEARARLIAYFGLRLLPLEMNRRSMVDTTYANRDFANRVATILEHLDKIESLKKKDGIAATAVDYILNSDAKLPDPDKESQNIVVNTHTSTSAPAGSGGDSVFASEDELQDWVWWALGIGGSCVILLIFVIIFRAMSRNDEESVHSARRRMEDMPSTQVYATLTDVNAPGRCWDVSKPSVTVGRSSSADVRLPSAHISGIHFSLFCDAAGKWMIKDAHSTNGTFVNGQKITDVTPVNNGDTITLADMQVCFRAR